MEKILLNCENYESAINSMCLVFGCKSNELIEFLEDVDLDSEYDNAVCTPNDPPYECLWKKTMEKFQIKNHVNVVRWFHFSSAFSWTNFDEGILPLGKIIDSIWDNLLKHFERKNFSIFENLKKIKEEPFGFYYNKINDNSNSGPYAFLIKEIYKDPKEAGIHNYLRMPEIVDDICDAYCEKFGKNNDIRKEVELLFVPRIVTFEKKCDIGDDYLDRTLYYIYLMIHKKNLPSSLAIAIDFENTKIDKKHIISIESVDSFWNKNKFNFD